MNRYYILEQLWLTTRPAKLNDLKLAARHMAVTDMAAWHLEKASMVRLREVPMLAMETNILRRVNFSNLPLLTNLSAVFPTNIEVTTFMRLGRAEEIPFWKEINKIIFRIMKKILNKREHIHNFKWNVLNIVDICRRCCEESERGP